MTRKLLHLVVAALVIICIPCAKACVGLSSTTSIETFAAAPSSIGCETNSCICKAISKSEEIHSSRPSEKQRNTNFFQENALRKTGSYSIFVPIKTLLVLRLQHFYDLRQNSGTNRKVILRI